ncbi:HEAT repeat domain-containing protein [Sorangium sp. So ce233]|uniref:HEAT repeat domain-containing protein n=1 Tax=Sorangium sp. So ce233 TaxID=3133290 RepID=UPI003F6071F6
MPDPHASASASPPPSDAVDALILCALQDELEGVLAVGDHERAGWIEQRDAQGFRCYRRTFDNGRGGRLRLVAAWTGEMGRLAAANRAQQLIYELAPACLAMCGICAGDRKKVALGDVIVADQLYSYDEGKLRAEEGNPSVMWHSLRTFDLAATWKMDAAFLARELDLSVLQAARPRSRASQRRWLLSVLLAHEEAGVGAPANHPDRKMRCPDWTDVVREAQRAGLVRLGLGKLSLTEQGRERAQEDQLLHPDGLPDDPPFQIHVGAIATGAAVQEDPALFDRLRRLVRTTLGVEMEGAAIGDVAARFARPAIVVKAVSDHADNEKDDSFRKFGCRASAEVLLAFLRKHLDPGEKPRPRVLVAGPWFGVSKELRPELERIWKEEPPDKALALISAKLRHAEVRQAQVAAVLRYDVILDLSPWQAFAGRWSLGLRDVEREPAREGPPAPLLYVVVPEGELPSPEDGAPACILDRLAALRSQEPPLAMLAQRIYEVSGSGIALAGFSTRTWEWCRPLFDMWPARFIGEPGVGLGPSDRFVHSSELLDTTIREPSFQDYLRALRVTAGQVSLAGETTPRPIREVYVDLEIQHEDERRKDSAPVLPGEEDRATSEALRDEIEARRKAAWDVPGSEVLPASAIHDVARRILLWGPAGTGKSTLLRYLACRVADEGRIPLWLPRIVDLGEDPEEVLAARALESVGLPDGPSPARTHLRDAVKQGRAFLFLDGFDEAPPAVRRALPGQIRCLHTEIRVVVASRPLHRMHTGLKEITLTGLPVTGAEEMLRAYFKNEDWIESLLRVLDTLPDGMAWMRNPVLLGLAAASYRRERALPNATLHLYGRVIDHMLGGRPWPPGEVLPALKLQARRMLLPDEGEPTVTVRESDLPYRYREAMLASGLFTGDEWLRFAHLTLGEYLAAGADDFSLEEHRRRERARLEGSAEDETALDVLAMAHALQDSDRALDEALSDAQDDTPGHRMLRLLLRAIGYGGDSVRQFCAWRGEELLEILAARMQAPSGRFGDFERLLMADAERALLVLRPHARGEVAGRIEASFAPMLATRGEAGTEAHIALWNLGVRKPERRSSRWWPTIQRQARAMVRSGLDVDDLFEMTEGGERTDRVTAVAVLAQYHQDYWEHLRPLFDDRDRWIRADMSEHLADAPAAEPYIRERLHDDESFVRRAAAHALVKDPKRLAANFDRVLVLIDDSDTFLQQGTIHYLKNDARAKTKIREFLRHRVNWSWNHARDEAVAALVDDPESEQLISQFLENSTTYHSRAFLYLATNTKWHPLLRKRLSRGDPEPDVVKALAQDLESRPLLRKLLDHQDSSLRVAAVKALRDDDESRPRFVTFLTEDADEWVRQACIEVLGDDPAQLPRIARVLWEDNDHNPRVEAIRALSKHSAITRDHLWKYFDEIRGQPDRGHIVYHLHRVAIVRELGDDPASRPYIEQALTDPDADVRKAAIEALAHSGGAREKIFMCLEDADDGVRQAACLALKDDRSVRERLVPDLRVSEEIVCIVGLRLLVRHNDSRRRIQLILANGPEKRRSTVVQPLAYDIESRSRLLDCLTDRNMWVRRAAAHALRRIPEAKRRLRALLETLSSLRFRASAHFSLDYIVEILAEDPDAHAPLLARARQENDDNVLAALIPALAHYPEAHGFLHEQIIRSDAYPNVRAAAIEALAGNECLRPVFISSLEDTDHHVRAAAVKALAGDAGAVGDAGVKRRLCQLLSHDRQANVRHAALDALSHDNEALAIIRERIDDDDDAYVRKRMVELLAGDTAAAPLLRKRLSDRSSDARFAAVSALRLSPVPQGIRLDSLASISLALHLAGTSPAHGTPLPSAALRDRLEAFCDAPRSQNLDNDPEFAEALLGYLCARLCWASEDGNFANGRVFGEVEQPVDRILALDNPLIIRVAMDSSELPRERFLHPSHNLIEAWRVATHLFARNPPTILLACADVAFEHLTAPGAAPDLVPGEVCWGPSFFGFRLRQAKTEAMDPLEWLVSSEAREVWIQADKSTRDRYLETLTSLAMSPSLDVWAVVPVLDRVGDLLPISIRAAFAQRLPRGMEQGARSLERAARNLGSFETSHLPSFTTSLSGLTASSVPIQLQKVLDIVRTTLRGEGSIDPAIEAFEASVSVLSSNDIADTDRNAAAMLLSGLRNRLSTVDQAKRVLAVAETIDEAKLSRVARRGLHDFISWLRTWRIT